MWSNCFILHLCSDVGRCEKKITLPSSSRPKYNLLGLLGAITFAYLLKLTVVEGGVGSLGAPQKMKLPSKFRYLMR